MAKGRSGGKGGMTSKSASRIQSAASRSRGVGLSLWCYVHRVERTSLLYSSTSRGTSSGPIPSARVLSSLWRA